MNKKNFTYTFIILSGLLLFLSINFAYADEICAGCEYESSCYAYGDTLMIGMSSFYCDYPSGNFVLQKTNGSCINDFECVENYYCIDGNCTNTYNQIIMGQELFNQIGAIENLCMGSGLFCYNSSLPAPLNTGVIAKNCTAPNLACYTCNSDYYWDSSASICRLPSCDSTPGCLNKTNLSDAYTLRRECAVAGYKCFRCNSGYSWDGTACKKDLYITPCSNDCLISGNRQCSGNAYKICGNYDSDSCLEWSTIVNCVSGQICSNGNCISNNPLCTPKCANKECGDDGCGGSCGICTLGEICSNGECLAKKESQKWNYMKYIILAIGVIGGIAIVSSVILLIIKLKKKNGAQDNSESLVDWAKKAVIDARQKGYNDDRIYQMLRNLGLTEQQIKKLL